jgi:molybdate transport system ATP-binding protein
MDEPLSSLDMARRDEIMCVIERIRDELEVPMLYVSHDRREIERLASTIVDLQGSPTACGSTGTFAEISPARRAS